MNAQRLFCVSSFSCDEIVKHAAVPYADRPRSLFPADIPLPVLSQCSEASRDQVVICSANRSRYPSDSAVAPGNRFSLVVEVVPHSRLHVYAPGAEASGYRVISLTIQPNAQVRVLPMQYPASEIYFFKPLNERIPVFQKPFRLFQELVLDGTPAGQEAMRGKRDLTLTGTLEYQACDERICYNPVSVPLSWKLSLRQVIRERPTGSA